MLCENRTASIIKSRLNSKASMQEGRSLAFWSRALSKRAQFKSIYECELMPIVLPVQRRRHYLSSITLFLLIKGALNFSYEMEKQHKWATTLIGCDFEIHYT